MIALIFKIMNSHIFAVLQHPAVFLTDVVAVCIEWSVSNNKLNVVKAKAVGASVVRRLIFSYVALGYKALAV